MPNAVSNAPLHLFDHNNQNEVQHDFWSHDEFYAGISTMMLIALSTAPLHFVAKDDQTEV